MIEKFKTLFINFNYLKDILKKEINILTAQRLLNKQINQFVIDKNILSTKAKVDLLEKYKNICENKKELIINKK